MGLLDATRRRLLVSWILLVMIVGLVTVVRLMPYPYRSIIDGGVVVGLSWGILSILWYAWRVSRGHQLACSADLPDL